MTNLPKALALAALLAGCGLSGFDSSANGADSVGEITVGAASDLRPAFEEIGSLFTAMTGTKVTFSFGSSGQLREQIINGAPFDLFASANSSYVDEVIKAGRGAADTKTDYAFGRIVVWAGPNATLPSLLADLADSQYRRIAIANPSHAPYGLAAQEALQSSGIYATVKDRLVFGENISDAFQIAKSGNADVGIIALSLAIADGGAYLLIPSEAHNALEQALVVTSVGQRSVAARALIAFISSKTGRDVMLRWGFALPGEQVPVG